jgi:hypothetical protein
MVNIEQKIVGVALVGPAAPAVPPCVHEGMERPEVLPGTTYRIKTPLSEHALYVTINDVVLSDGSRRPFEVFINSKAMDHFQWIVALTRIMSAVFRKGGEVAFLVDELRSVFDPKGGYFKKGGKFMPSLVAEIGDVLEVHLRALGLVADDKDPHVEAFLEEKRREVSAAELGIKLVEVPGATLCPKCREVAVRVVDGCSTCLSCGDSKCG